MQAHYTALVKVVESGTRYCVPAPGVCFKDLMLICSRGSYCTDQHYILGDNILMYLYFVEDKECPICF